MIMWILIYAYQFLISLSSECKIKREIKELFSTAEPEVLNILKNQLNQPFLEGKNCKGFHGRVNCLSTLSISVRTHAVDFENWWEEEWFVDEMMIAILFIYSSLKIPKT